MALVSICMMASDDLLVSTKRIMDTVSVIEIYEETHEY